MIRARIRLIATLAALVFSAAPLSVQAWWSSDFKQRTVVTLNTSAAGVTTSEAISDVAVPIRLHSGNFDFVGAKPDGSDLRVVAADDKTPLKFSVEKFDGANELAVLWVRVPLVPTPPRPFAGCRPWLNRHSLGSVVVVPPARNHPGGRERRAA